MYKHIKLLAKPHPKGMACVIVEQTHRNNDFGGNTKIVSSYTFMSSNGIYISSEGHPYWYTKGCRGPTLCMRGRAAHMDNHTFVVPMRYWEPLKQAIEEYNEDYKE